MQSLWILVSASLFSVMGLAIKFLASSVPTFEAVFARGAVALLLLVAWASLTGRSFATPFLRLHAQRSFTGVAGLTTYFFAIGALPLSTATTLNYTSPLFVAMLSVATVWLAEKRLPAPALLGCIFAGFVGICLVLKPVFSAGDVVPAMVGLVSGLLSAAAYWSIRAFQGSNEPEWRIVFYFSGVTTLVGLAGMALFGAVWPAPRDWGLLLAVGTLALFAQLALTRAFAHGKTLLASSLQYLTVVFAAILGHSFAGDVFDPLAITGIAIVLISGVTATIVTVRSSPRPEQEKMNVSDTD
jgi:drug/metabolite transporter (DMT)-like permease